MELAAGVKAILAGGNCNVMQFKAFAEAIKARECWKGCLITYKWINPINSAEEPDQAMQGHRRSWSFWFLNFSKVNVRDCAASQPVVWCGTLPATATALFPTFNFRPGSDFQLSAATAG